MQQELDVEDIIRQGMKSFLNKLVKSKYLVLLFRLYVNQYRKLVGNFLLSAIKLLG